MNRMLSVFGWLLWQDLRVFFQQFFANLIDALVWPAAVVLVNSYILPLMGMQSNYGSFILIGTAASMCLFHAVNKAQVLVADIENIKNISYQLSLPLPAWLLFIKLGISFALTAACLNLLTIPAGKLILGHLFNTTELSWSKIVLIFATLNVFFGFYGLWIASLVKHVANFPHVWMRFVLPLWMLGGYQYSWSTLATAYPLMAKISLVNPMLYVFEGVRAAALGQAGSLNFWWCLSILWIFTAFLYVHTLYVFKKRLDYV